jgi:acyl-coenzyme A thioesterase 9
MTRDNDRQNIYMNTTMTLLIRPLLRPIVCIGTALRPVQRQYRSFSVSSPCHTDGVYSELTAMRTRTPFIEALRKEQERQINAQSASPAHESRLEPSPSLLPRSMSDSYHRVVSHVSGTGSPFISDN